jgi:hypothetical protein
MTGIKNATLDLLDSSIPEEFDKWQSFNDEVRFPHYKETVRTDPTIWKRHCPDDWSFSLKWDEFRYADVMDAAALRKTISSELPGIYIFGSSLFSVGRG